MRGDTPFVLVNFFLFAFPSMVFAGMFAGFLDVSFLFMFQILFFSVFFTSCFSSAFLGTFPFPQVLCSSSPSSKIFFVSVGS